MNYMTAVWNWGSGQVHALQCFVLFSFVSCVLLLANLG